jgi:hypothetical protein
MEIDSETMPSPPSIVQRETYIFPVAPVDMPKDIAVGHKMPTWARQTLQEAEGRTSPQGTSQESKRPKIFSIYLSTMRHIIDSEPSCHGEATCEHVWQDAMTK